MIRIRLKLYKTLRSIGLERTRINLFAIFNERLSLDNFDEACYLNLIERNFNIQIPDNEIPRLGTIDSTVNYLQVKTNKEINRNKLQQRKVLI